jgi:hypothetical protein
VPPISEYVCSNRELAQVIKYVIKHTELYWNNVYVLWLASLHISCGKTLIQLTGNNIRRTLQGLHPKAVQKWMSIPVYAMSLRLEFNDKIRVDTCPTTMSIPATDHLVYWSIQDQCIPVNTGIIKHRSDLGGLLDFWLNLVTLGRPWSINIPFAVALPVSAPL